MRATITTNYAIPTRNVIIERACDDGLFVSYLNTEHLICRMRFIPMEHVIAVTPAPKAPPARPARILDASRVEMITSHIWAMKARTDRDYGMARYWLKSARFERGLCNRLPA
jgi:hypothetical protein